MAGKYVMPDGVFINKECEQCYYVNKVDSQKIAIIRYQSANRKYKERIAQLEQQIKVRDRKIKNLKQQVHDWTYAVNGMPYIFKRWTLWRYSKRN